MSHSSAPHKLEKCTHKQTCSFFFKISLNELTKRALLRDPFISMYADFKTAIKNCV